MVITKTGDQKQCHKTSVIVTRQAKLHTILQQEKTENLHFCCTTYTSSVWHSTWLKCISGMHEVIHNCNVTLYK